MCLKDHRGISNGKNGRSGGGSGRRLQLPQAHSRVPWYFCRCWTVETFRLWLDGSWVGQHSESRLDGCWAEYIFIFNFYKQRTWGNHTYNVKHNCQNKTEVFCGPWKGWREGRTLYIGDLNRFQKSGVIQGHTVFSLAWSISWLPQRGSGSVQSIRRMGSRETAET